MSLWMLKCGCSCGLPAWCLSRVSQPIVVCSVAVLLHLQCLLWFSGKCCRRICLYSIMETMATISLLESWWFPWQLLKPITALSFLFYFILFYFTTVGLMATVVKQIYFNTCHLWWKCVSNVYYIFKSILQCIMGLLTVVYNLRHAFCQLISCGAKQAVWHKVYNQWSHFLTLLLVFCTVVTCVFVVSCFCCFVCVVVFCFVCFFVFCHFMFYQIFYFLSWFVFFVLFCLF